MRYRVPLREDGLFFSTGSAALQPFVCLLESRDSVQAALADKHIWIVGGSTYAREHLASLFTHLRTVTRGVTDTHCTFEEKDREELQALCERLAAEPGGHVVLLAEDQYREAFNQVCQITPALLPILLPTGILLPALPSGRLHEGALLLKKDAALEFLQGKTATVWGKGRKCLDRIFRLLAPIFASMTIAGVVHETLKSLTIGGGDLSVYPPEAAGTLSSEIVVTTQEILEDNNYPFVTIQHYTPIFVLRNEDNCLSCDAEFIIFYSLHKSSYKYQMMTYKQKLTENTVLRNGYFVRNIESADIKKSEYENGFRKTAWQPKKFTNKIHILGASHTEGLFISSFENTYCSILQYILNEKESDAIYSVQNLGVRGIYAENSFLCLLDNNITNGDIVIFHNKLYNMNEIEYISAMNKFCINNSAHFFVLTHVKIDALNDPHKDDFQHLDTCCYTRGALFNDSINHMQKKDEFIAALHTNCIRAFDLLECIDGAPYGVFADTSHLNEAGHKLVAEYIYQKITVGQTFDISETYAKCIVKTQEYVRFATLSREENTRWLDAIPRIRESASEIVGSIVMNCNPFTLGHKHIIAESLHKVDKLYIFVVQEDKSYFTFEERYAMVCDGVKEFGSRVCVVPSGKLIISSTTFPDYFCKDTITYEPDTHTDILIFASTIAPTLGIQVRLFGDEPFCKVTSAYHEQLEKLLPICGILPVRIPRLQSGDTAISASRVRKILEERKFSQLATLVPPTSMPYLLKKALSDTADAPQRHAV